MPLVSSLERRSRERRSLLLDPSNVRGRGLYGSNAKAQAKRDVLRCEGLRALVVAAAALGLAGLGCSSVSGSGVATGAPGRGSGVVHVRAITLPRPGREVGIVEAKGHHEMIEDVMPEFARQVAALGGNYGLVDRITSRYELQTYTETYSYACGKSTCTGTRTSTREVETLSIVGRAFYLDPEP